uniref:NADH-ubiquinone oxidoreductase chain 1 n=1 Tax=Lepidotrigona flavibasis TaxID=2696055 RepID=A0A6B9MS14_9HYME|nr:NADH dehydrogenase subunit 1 [Lepidotrigona flavibasis]
MVVFMSFFLMILMVLLSVAFLTLYERKILSYMQYRKGPNKMSFKGMLQPFSDMIKLITKEMMMINSNMMFYYSPMAMFILSSLFWINYPWIYNNLNIKYSMIFMLFIMSLNVYPVLLIGWVSSNNYSILSMMRAVSQMISFEVLIYVIVLIVMMMIEDFMFTKIINYQLNIKFFIFMYPLYFMLLMSMLIDLNRVPFDLIEGESELVSGFNLEYYSSLFTLIFLSEYMSLLFVSLMITVMFFGVKSWSAYFLTFWLFNMNVLVMVRGVLARIRYDCLMYMCWKELLVMSIYYMMYLYLLKEINMMMLS